MSGLYGAIGEGVSPVGAGAVEVRVCVAWSGRGGESPWSMYADPGPSRALIDQLTPYAPAVWHTPFEEP